MRTGSSALLPLLRSEVQGEVLALLFLHPDETYTVTTVANTIRRPVQSVQKELTRLAGAGLLTDRKVGNMRYVSANTDTPLFEPLAELMAVTFGPEPVLRDLFKATEGLQEVYIYGSWAARRMGEAGPVPRDIDVLVVGTTPRNELDELADQAEAALHREVHIRRVLPPDWESAATSFLVEVKSRPLVRVGGGNG